MDLWTGQRYCKEKIRKFLFRRSTCERREFIFCLLGSMQDRGISHAFKDEKYERTHFKVRFVTNSVYLESRKDDSI